MSRKRLLLAGVAVGLCAADPAAAHHSPAAYDMTAQVTVEGVIAELDWRNPHIYIAVETVGADGATVLERFELASIASLQPYGLTRDVLAPGRGVTVRAHPARRAGGTMLALDLTMEDGAGYRVHPRGRGVIQAATAPAEGIAGQWLPPPSSFLGFLAAVDGAALTERALVEREDLEALAESQASCAGYFPPPQLMVASYLQTIEVSDTEVVIRIDGVSGERVIAMEETPGALDADAEPERLGRSIARWEGETLVIESAAFIPHAEGVGRRVPSGPDKRLTERLTLSEDRNQLVYELTLTDPDYLAAPLSYSARFDHRPDAVPSGEPCDEATARRFLEEEQQ
jgi:hypothetical protein